jgi:uncharacterized lipoprotein YbaY/heat shock protein HslJ
MNTRMRMPVNRHWLLLFGLAITLVFVTACGGDEATATPAPRATEAPEPTLEPAVSPTAAPVIAPDAPMLANMEYQSEFTAAGTAPLSGGEYREPAAPGSATEIVVMLTEFAAVGELDGQPAAAVILVTDPGGSGTFYDLAVVMEQDGQPMNVATTPLGDRVQINSLSIADNQIVVDMIAQGPNDPMCCPTQQVLQTYELQDGALVQVSSEVAGTAQTGEGTAQGASADIVGVVWKWERFMDQAGVNDIIVDDPDKYTLTLGADGQYSFQADCNSGGGNYILRDGGITFQPGPVTLAECGPDSLYTDFLELLGDVVTYVVDDGKLVLNLKMDAGDMIFASSEALESADRVDSDIVDIVWLWQSFTDTAGQNDIVVPNPEQYRLQLRPGGQFEYQADCNLGSGSYTLEGGSLTLELGPATMAECGPDSLFDQYISLLAQVATYVQEEEILILNLMADGGDMAFGKLNAVTGQVLATRNPPLPESSTMEVKVMDVSLADVPATQVGGQVVANVMQFPIPFEAPYDPEAIQANHDYALDVKVMDADGNLLFTNTQAYQVITKDSAVHNIRVTVEGVGEGGGGAPSVDIEPSQIGLDTQDLPYSWQANIVPGTPYDESKPPGPMGMPEHVQINFSVTDPADKAPGDPVMYIIPIDAYRQLWEAAGNQSVTRMIDRIYQRTVALPAPPPASVYPALPYEEIGAGVNDLAVQLDRAASADESASKDGFRFLGRWKQDPNPVINGDLRYIYQGFTNDARYLVAFFYPVTTSALPDSVDDVTPEERRDVATNIGGYLQGKAETLNDLSGSDWEPDLAQLDALVGSLTIAGTPASGIYDKVWQLAAWAPDAVNEDTLADTENYTLTFRPDGTLEFQADCNTGTATYTMTGAVTGGVRIELGPTTLAECGPDSLADDMLNLLEATQDYRVRPGGDRLELLMPAGGPIYMFDSVGSASETEAVP